MPEISEDVFTLTAADATPSTKYQRTLLGIGGAFSLTMASSQPHARPAGGGYADAAGYGRKHPVRQRRWMCRSAISARWRMRLGAKFRCNWCSGWHRGLGEKIMREREITVDVVREMEDNSVTGRGWPTGDRRDYPLCSPSPDAADLHFIFSSIPTAQPSLFPTITSATPTTLGRNIPSLSTPWRTPFSGCPTMTFGLKPQSMR
jgi:hypothetical protein